MNHKLFIHFVPNLFLNTYLAFIIFSLLVEGFLFLFRIRSNQWKFYFRLIPLLKVFFNIFLYKFTTWSVFQNIDLSNLEENSRNLMVAAGISPFRVYTELEFKTGHGKGFHFGLFDMLFSNIAPFWIALIAYSILAMTCVRLVFFILNLIKEKKETQVTCKPYPIHQLPKSLQEKLKKKKVTVELLDKPNTSPYATGIFKPRIRLPVNAHDILSQKQVESILMHELSHITNFDLLLAPFLQFMKALFPLLPLSSLKLTKEKGCDESSLNQGYSPLDLAEALKTLAVHVSAPKSVLCHHFIAKRSIFKRVRNLLHHKKRTRNIKRDTAMATFLALLFYFILNSKIGYF